MVVNWCEFIDTAFDHGWKIETVLRKLEEAIIDVYGRDYWEQLKSKIVVYISSKL